MEPEQFEAIVRDTINTLPAHIRDAMDNIEILVVDEPGEAPGNVSSDLLGLYTGVPLPERGVDYAGELPDVIYIFRRPHLKLGLPPDELGEEIAATLVHEVAHHFGIEDDRLDELDWG
jgi:predicted Zn-dependent protease with MMP-like domain